MKDTSKHGNRYDTGPTLSVAVGDCRGGWNNGHFTGDRPLVKQARLAADLRIQVLDHGVALTADANTPLGAYAALASYSPGRVLVYGDAPEDVEAHLGRYGRGDVLDDRVSKKAVAAGGGR